MAGEAGEGDNIGLSGEPETHRVLDARGFPETPNSLALLLGQRQKETPESLAGTQLGPEGPAFLNLGHSSFPAPKLP